MKLHHKIFFLLLALSPTQLAYHFWPDWSLIRGIRIDYLSPTLYLLDLIIFLLILLWVLETKNLKRFFPRKKTLILLAIFIFSLINIFVSLNRPVAIYKWLKLYEILTLALYVSLNKKYLITKINLILLVPLSFVSVISALQVIKARTIGGPLYWLGERSFTISTPGISLVNIFSKTFLRPYATFPHPNALGGFALVSLFLILAYPGKKNLKYLGLFLSLFLIFISFSQNAWFTFIILTIAYLVHKKLEKLFFLTPSLLVLFSLIQSLVTKYLLKIPNLPEYLTKRLVLSELAGKAFAHSPFFGIGFGSYLNYISLQKNWWLHPVHNIYLLLASEGGIIALITFFIFMMYLLQKNKNIFLSLSLLGIFITGSLDHYWLTLEQNQIIFAIVVGLSL